MSIPPYAWVFSDPFHSIFVICTTSLSFFSNFCLLFIISSPASSQLGAYRYLLASFAVCDMMTSATHALVLPLVHMTSYGFYFFPQHAGRNILFGVSLDTPLCLLFVATYYQTFIVLAFHFVYRCVTVKSGLSGSFTASRLSTFQWALIALVVYCLYTSFFVGVSLIALTPSEETRAIVPPEVFDLYGVDLTNPNCGFTVASIKQRNPFTCEMAWHAPTLVAELLLFLVFGGTGSVILYCIIQISRAMRSLEIEFSATSRQLQKNLFHALLIQVR
ncbi:hypothetical protein PFISCL1PPCAC_14094, partial [Pristionchus fissidentatus]